MRTPLPSDLPDVLNSREAARFLRISEKTLHSLLKQRQLPAFKCGKQHRFLKDTLKRWAQDGGRGNPS